MGSGGYVAERPGGEPIGHFGLALHDDTHSTAPNRRFPDLITQRMVEAALLRQSHPGQQYDAIVTGVSDTDTWVRIFAPPAEGRLEAGAQALESGRPVRIRLVSTDVERGIIDFARVDRGRSASAGVRTRHRRRRHEEHHGLTAIERDRRLACREPLAA